MYDGWTMMFPANGKETARSIDGDPSVLTMTDVGFLARKHDGSAVNFEKDDYPTVGRTGSSFPQAAPSCED